MKLLLKIKNGTPPMRKAALRQITDKAREMGAGPLFNQILPLLMSPTLEDQERHLLVKVSHPATSAWSAVYHHPVTRVCVCTGRAVTRVCVCTGRAVTHVCVCTGRAVTYVCVCAGHRQDPVQTGRSCEAVRTQDPRGDRAAAHRRGLLRQGRGQRDHLQSG